MWRCRPRSGGRLVRQAQRLPESLDAGDVTGFLVDLGTHRDRAMVLGGLRAAEVRSLRLADIDMGLRRVRVVGKGGKERVVPIDEAFFTECAAYLRAERPPGCRTLECFVVLRGPTQGRAMTEAGLRKVFRIAPGPRGSYAGAASSAAPHLRHRVGTGHCCVGCIIRPGAVSSNRMGSGFGRTCLSGPPTARYSL